MRIVLYTIIMVACKFCLQIGSLFILTMIRPFLSRCLVQCRHANKCPYQSAQHFTSSAYTQCHIISASYSTNSIKQGSPLLTLPWSKLPYNSVRVNLSEAVQQGWDEIEDFPHILKGECTVLWCA